MKKNTLSCIKLFVFLFVVTIVKIAFINFTSEATTGEIYCSKDKIFSITLPEGWRWVPSPIDLGCTLVYGEDINNDIVTIAVLPVSEFEDKKIYKDEILKQLRDSNIENVIKRNKGEVANEKESEIDGAYAHQIDFTLPSGAGARKYTIVNFIKADYVFSICFPAFHGEGSIPTEKIVKSIKVPANQCDVIEELGNVIYKNREDLYKNR
jgi:hypothetical protein